jgi:hypothetical protein
MKQFTIILAMMLLSGTAFGQNIIEQHFSSYKQQDHYTSVHISSKAFELAAYLELEDASEELAEFKEFLNTVNSFDMIAGQHQENAAQLYRTALKRVKASHEEVMTVQEADGTFSFLIDESNGIVHELVMVGNGPQEWMVFSLTGNMDINQLSKMSQWMQTDDEGQVRRLFEHGLHEVKVYPNPSRKGEPIVVEVPAGMVDGDAYLLNLNGTRVKSYSLGSTYQKLETGGLAAGQYILEFRNGEVSIRKKVLIR